MISNKCKECGQEKPPRCIVSEINKMHCAYVREHGDKNLPKFVMLGKWEAAMVHRDMTENRLRGANDVGTIETFLHEMKKGQIQIYTPCGPLSLHAVDVDLHLSLGWSNK